MSGNGDHGTSLVGSQPIVPEIISPDPPDSKAYLDEGLSSEDAAEVRSLILDDTQPVPFDPEAVMEMVTTGGMDVNTMHPTHRYHLVEYLHYECSLNPTKIATKLGVPVSRVRRDLDIIHNALGAKPPGSFMRQARGRWHRRNEAVFHRAMAINDLPTAARVNEAYVTGLEKFGDIKSAPEEVHVTGELSLLSLVSRRPPPRPIDPPSPDNSRVPDDDDSEE